MIDKVKAVRQAVSEFEASTRKLGDSNEVVQAATALHNTFLFCGEFIKELGEVVPKVEDTTVKVPSKGKLPDFIRELQRDVETNINEVRTWFANGPIRQALYTQILTGLVSAKLFLGEELNRIKGRQLENPTKSKKTKGSSKTEDSDKS